MTMTLGQVEQVVSTHSRLKAAGRSRWVCFETRLRFNTQPPKGGWIFFCFYAVFSASFNTQPPKGGWASFYPPDSPSNPFQHTAA